MKNFKRFVNELNEWGEKEYHESPQIEKEFVHISDKLVGILNKMDNKFAKLLLKTQTDNTGFRNKFADYIDYNDETGMFTYLFNITEISDDPYKQSGRNPLKPTKIFTKIVINHTDYLKDNDVTQRDIELFSNDIKPKTDKIVEWKGEDILKAYNYTGLLRTQFSRSCANFDQTRLTNNDWEEPEKEWYDVYVQNPDNISVLVVLNPEGNVAGRRMLFKGEQFENSKNYKKGEHVGIGSNYYGEGGYGSKYDVIITKWLTDNGYAKFDNYDRTTGNVMIQLKNWKFPKFPPIDAFYINLDNGVLSYPNYDGNGAWRRCYKLTQNNIK